MLTVPLIISREDLKNFRNISGNLTAVIVNPMILDAQEFELRPFLGDDLYIDLLESMTADKYQDLLEGKTFEFPAGSAKNKRFTGLKSALCYFTLSTIVSEGGAHVTATGTYEKDNEFSRGISGPEKQRISNNYRDKALSILTDARHYLQTKKTEGLFPLWRNGANLVEAPEMEPGIGRAHRIKNLGNRQPRRINGDECF